MLSTGTEYRYVAGLEQVASDGYRASFCCEKVSWEGFATRWNTRHAVSFGAIRRVEERALPVLVRVLPGSWAGGSDVVHHVFSSVTLFSRGSP
jgi:hypothetical protein